MLVIRCMNRERSPSLKNHQSVVVLCASFALLSVDAADGRGEILRDTWGIPHVFADTDAGAFYGLGYATAEDRAFQMTYSLRIIQGRLAEVVGEVRQLLELWSESRLHPAPLSRAAVEKLTNTRQALDRQTIGEDAGSRP